MTAFLILLANASEMIALSRPSAAPAHMSRTALRSEGGCGGRSAMGAWSLAPPPVGYGW